MTVFTVIAGLLGGSWVTRSAHYPRATTSVAIPGRRRSAAVVVDLEIVAPNGSVWSPRLKAGWGETTLGPLNVLQRHVTLQLEATRFDVPLKATATAPPWQGLPPFLADITEDIPVIWRLPLHQGLATVRARLHRELADG